MANKGYCGVCNCKTSAYVDDDGVLCSKHHQKFEEAEREIQNKRRFILDEIRELKRALSDEDLTGYHYHYSDRGQYIIDCHKCGDEVRSNTESGFHLCSDCSSKVEGKESDYNDKIAALEKRDEKLWCKLQKDLPRRFNLRVS